jgi:hypothetical protein
MNMKNIKVIAGLLAIITIMASMASCAEEGQFYRDSSRGFEFSYPSGWLFEEEPNGVVEVYKEGEAFIYIKDLTDDIIDADYEYPLIDRAEYAAEEFLMEFNGGRSVGTLDYMFTEDASGEFVTGSVSDTIYIDDEEMPFTLTITKVDNRMIADVIIGKDQKSFDDANKARKTIMNSIKTVGK